MRTFSPRPVFFSFLCNLYLCWRENRWQDADGNGERTGGETFSQSSDAMSTLAPTPHLLQQLSHHLLINLPPSLCAVFPVNQCADKHNPSNLPYTFWPFCNLSPSPSSYHLFPQFPTSMRKHINTQTGYTTGLTRYLQPPQAQCGALPTERDALRERLVVPTEGSSDEQQPGKTENG